MSNGSRPGRDSTGTSDTILSGTSKSQKCRQQSSRLWVDKGAFWETLEPTDQSVTLGNSAQHLLFELKVANQVVQKKPSLLLIPALFCLVVTLLSVLGVRAAANETHHAAREERLARAQTVNLLYEQQATAMLEQRLTLEAVTSELQGQLVDGLERAVTPLRMVELAVRQNPQFPYMEDHFDSIAPDIMSITNLPGEAYSIGLAPFGKVAKKYPLAGNEGAIGHDNMNHCQMHPNQTDVNQGLCGAMDEACVGVEDKETGVTITDVTRCYPSRRTPTFLSVTTKTLTLDGPIRLTQGGPGPAFIMRHPIFINTTGAAYNATFGRNYNATDCVEKSLDFRDDTTTNFTILTTPCFDEQTGMRYWGMSDSLLAFNRWLELSAVEMTASRTGVSYSIFDPVKSFTLVESAVPVAEESIDVDVGAYNRVLKLRTSPVAGWLKQTVKQQDVASLDVERPTWEGPLTAFGVLLGVTLGVALLTMLVHKEFHQTLLRSMLPVKTLPYVERGRNFCEQFQTVTILFSDIVSYTNLAATMHPLEVVNMLNELYFMYDRLVERHNVYKVETIGDAFMCAGGVPDAASPVAGACAIADMGLDMIESTRRFVTSGGLSLQIRVGMHSGPVVGAVIGLKMPHYCLFGDTVNTASRMESNSESMRIHLSATTYNLLKSSNDKAYNLGARGEMDIKGKGKMFTYWLDAPPSQATETTIVSVTEVNLQ